MKTYKFEVNKLVKVWAKEYHSVEAKSMEEAEAIMIKNAEEDKTNGKALAQFFHEN